MFWSQCLYLIEIIEDVRNFVRDFKDKKITVKRFLEGPESIQQLGREMMEEMMEQMFREMIEDEFGQYWKLMYWSS